MKEPVENEVSFSVGEPVAKLVKEDDGYYLVDNDGTKTGPLGYVGYNASKVSDENPATAIALPKNASCRQWCSIKKAEAEIADHGYVTLTYKPHKTIGSVGPRTLNANLVKYLPEDLRAEYDAIIARAVEARTAAMNKPKTELEKAQEKLAKAQAALEKLLAESGN